MKRYLIVLCFILAATSALAIECGEAIDHNINLNTDLRCDSGIITAKEGLTINCNGHAFEGEHAGVAIQVVHDNTRVTNCNFINYFTAIDVGDVQNITVSDVHILNASTGIRAEKTKYLTLKNAKIQKAKFYDLYTKDTIHLIKENLDIQNHTSIDDHRNVTRIHANLSNYTFTRSPELITNLPSRALLNTLNISWVDHIRATQRIDYNTTVTERQTEVHYVITASSKTDLENLTVLVYFPRDFNATFFVRAKGAVMDAQNGLLQFRSNLKANTTEQFIFDVTTQLPRSQIKLPVTIPALPIPPRPSPRTAQRILAGLFALAVFFFLFTKKYLLKHPLGMKEELGILAGILALWALTYKFTIAAVQFAKDFVALLIILALMLHYTVYVYSHRKDLENL